MAAGARVTTLCLLASVAICAGAPGLAWSAPALYTGSVHLRLWERPVPYGYSLSGPGLVNSTPGEVSLAGTAPAAFTLPVGQLHLTTSLIDSSPPLTSLGWHRQGQSANCT